MCWASTGKILPEIKERARDDKIVGRDGCLPPASPTAWVRILAGTARLPHGAPEMKRCWWDVGDAAVSIVPPGAVGGPSRGGSPARKGFNSRLGPEDTAYIFLLDAAAIRRL